MKNTSNHIFTQYQHFFWFLLIGLHRSNNGNSIMEWSHTIAYFLLSVPLHLPAGQSNYLTTAHPFFVFCFFYFLSILTLPKNCCPALPLLALLPTLSPLSWTHMYTIPSSWYGWTYLLLYKLIAAWINIRQSKSGKPGVLGFFTQS